MNERRVNRLESLIKEKVATVLLRDMADPRLGIITITRVKLDREMALCKIYWSVFGGEKEQKINERTLRHAAGFVRREIAAILNTRSVPAVEFVFDESVAGSLRVEAILKQLRAERGPEAVGAADAADAGRKDEDEDEDEDEGEGEGEGDEDEDGDSEDDEGEDDDEDDDAPSDRRFGS